MEKIVLMFISLLALWVGDSHHHPVLDRDIPEDHDYLEGAQSEFPKANVDIQKNRENVPISEGNLIFAQKHESIEEVMLPPDEQEECYRQQNIDPPSKSQDSHSEKSSKAVIETALVPISDDAYSNSELQGPGEDSRSEKSSKAVIETALVPISDDAYSNSELQGPGEDESHKLSASEHVFSLYSHDELSPDTSENEHREQQENNFLFTDLHSGKVCDLDKDGLRPEFAEKKGQKIIQEKRSVEQLNQRVYKPIKHEAEFPVYDEDIEFRPDPLHGILDDKYWENQQDKGAVIRKYIDLAANNMVLNGAAIMKRNVDPAKPGFDERGDRCPCQQIVACKDCKKGKEEGGQEGKSTTNKKGSSTNKEKLPSSFSSGNALVDTNNPNRESINRKLMSFDYNDNEEDTNGNFHSYATSYYSRKLLSLENEGEDESYDDEEEEDDNFIREKYINQNIKPYFMKSFNNEEERGYNNYESLEEKIKDEYDPFRKEDVNLVESFPPRFQTGRNADMPREMNEYQNYFTSSKSYNHDNSTLLEMPMFGIHTSNPSLYVPNKFPSIMQKSRQEKPKSSQEETKLNPNVKLEGMENKNFERKNGTLSKLFNDISDNIYPWQKSRKEKPKSSQEEAKPNINVKLKDMENKHFESKNGTLSSSKLSNDISDDVSPWLKTLQEKPTGSQEEAKPNTNVKLEGMENKNVESINGTLSSSNLSNDISDNVSPWIKTLQEKPKDSQEEAKPNTNVKLEGMENKNVENINGKLSSSKLSNDISDNLSPWLKTLQETPKGSQEEAKPNPSVKLEAMDNKNVESIIGILSSSKISNDTSDNVHVQKGRRSPEVSGLGFLFNTSGSTLNPECVVPTTAITASNTNLRFSDQHFTFTTKKQVSTKPTQKKSRYQSKKTKVKTINEETADAEIASDIVETVLTETQKDVMLGYNLGLYRRNDSIARNYTIKTIGPETEKIVMLIKNCIMEKLKDQLAKQSCAVLDPELLEFLKWLVLSGDPYKNYSRKEKEFASGVKVSSQVSSQFISQSCDPSKGVCEPVHFANFNFESTSISSSSR